MSRTRFVLPIAIAAMLVTTVDARAAGWVPRPGIEVSGSYETVSRDDLLEGTSGAGWSVGATAQWGLAQNWALVSGLRYLEATPNKAFGLTFSGTGGSSTLSGEMRERWHWLAVPVHARVMPGASPFSIEAGPEVQVLLVARSRTNFEVPSSLRSAGGATQAIRLAPAADIFEDVGTLAGDRDVTDRYHRVNVVLGGGVSYAWPAGMGHVTAHARGGFGLNDLMKSEAIVRRTRTMEVGVGWQW